MMYLKQFPDICREMGFDVEEKAKTITLRITDINYSIDINKKLFLEDLELILDSYSEVREAIAIFEAKTKSGKYDNLDATELQKLKCVFDKAWETGRLKDDTGMFQTEVDTCHQHVYDLNHFLENRKTGDKTMARKEIKIFMDSKEVSNFLKVIDWSWLFTFLSERYNVSLSPHKELKELRDGAAIIKVEWPDELIEKCGMMADVFSSVKLVTFDSCFKQVVEYDEDKFNEEREAWFSHPTKIFSYLDCDGTVKERTLALNISLRYTLYDGGYNFATLLYAVYSDVNGWTVQMEKE